MLEKIRILVSQLVTMALVIFSAIRIGINIIDNTGVKGRLANIEFSYEFLESVAMGLLLVHLAALTMILVVWLMRWPKTNYTKKKKKRAKQIPMGTVSKIPQSAR